MTERTERETAGATSEASQDAAEARFLAFHDADSAKRWADGLSFANIGLACETVIGQLSALKSAEFAARERATIAEVLRDLVAYLHTELGRRYAGKAQPAVDRELDAAEHAIALWSGLWEQYSACLKPLIEGDPELAGVKAKILQRGLYVGKQLVLVHGLARRAVPVAIWLELNAYFRLAEILECTGSAVSDNLLPNAVGLSCYSMYSHALLLGLADPCAMSVKQIELTDRWLALWARKVFPYAEQRETEGPVILIDLETGEGAKLAAVGSQPPAESMPESMRFGYPAKLATSVRGRMKRLEGGASPIELQLGQDCSSEQCTSLLDHLDSKWYQLHRSAHDVPTATADVCAGGLKGAYFHVSGRSFDRKEITSRLSFADAQQLHTLGSVGPHSGTQDAADEDWSWERWQGTHGLRDLYLTRISDAIHRWTLDQLAVIRSDDRVRLGFVIRIALSPSDELSLTVRLWPGIPKALSLLPLLATGAEELIPALMLAEAAKDGASLILSPRTFNPSRVLRTADPTHLRRFRLTRLLQRGADFERVAFEETT
jgi:hypothetical protein